MYDVNHRFVDMKRAIPRSLPTFPVVSTPELMMELHDHRADSSSKTSSPENLKGLHTFKSFMVVESNDFS